MQVHFFHANFSLRRIKKIPALPYGRNDSNAWSLPTQHSGPDWNAGSQREMGIKDNPAHDRTYKYSQLLFSIVKITIVMFDCASVAEWLRG